MKKLLFILLGFCFAFQSMAQKQDRVPDFRSIEWGSMKDSIYRSGEKLEFVKVPDAKVKETYYLRNDDKSLGNVPLTAIHYLFTPEGHFYKVVLTGKKKDYEQVKFIVDYKFGKSVNETKVDGIIYNQWIIQDVTFTLADHEFHKFELEIESDWEAAEAYRKNTNVDDF